MKLPILMLHKVADTPAAARHPGNYLSPTRFDAILGALRGWGYDSITIDRWLDWREGRATLPARPVVITFDDGYRSTMEVAWPILRRHGLSATVFLVSDLLGQTNRWDADEIQEPLLSATDVRDLRREGMTFGSHTRTHAPLTRLEPAAALEEMRGSRLALESVLGEPVRVLCYPYSKQDVRVRRLAREAGYKAATRGGGQLNGKRRDPFALRRIKLDNTASPAWLRRELLRLRWLVFW